MTPPCYPGAAGGCTGDNLLRLLAGGWEMPPRVMMHPRSKRRRAGCLCAGFIPVVSRREEAGWSWDFWAAGCWGWGVSGSWAKPLSPLCPQNLQSLLRQCHSLSHLSLAGTDCPLDAVSTRAGGPLSKPLPSAPLPKLCRTAGGCCHPIPAGTGLRRQGMRRAAGSQPSDVPTATGGMRDSGFSRRKKGAPAQGRPP